MSGDSFPTCPWRLAPDGLATRRQLRARGLRPGGQDPVAQVERRRRRGRPPLVAYLYRIDLAVPVRPMTLGRWRAVHAALRARRTCPDCRQVREYCIPSSRGACNDCFTAALAASPPQKFSVMSSTRRSL